MIWLAMRINTILGIFQPYGPFPTKALAEHYIVAQEDPREWAVLRVEAP